MKAGVVCLLLITLAERTREEFAKGTCPSSW